MPDKKTIPGFAPTRVQRIKDSTKYGGLRELPDPYKDENADWETIKSADNPFEQLYLDYRAYDRITREMIDGNYAIILKFWRDTTARAMSSIQIAKKYGGMDLLRGYPHLLEEAHKKLIADGGQKQCFEKIIKKKLESLKDGIDIALKAGVYKPEIGVAIKTRGLEIDLIDEEITDFLLDILKAKGWEPQVEGSINPLSVPWGPTKRLVPEQKQVDVPSPTVSRKERAETRDDLKAQKDFDAFITEFLAGGIYDGDISPVVSKSRKLGFPEDEVLFRLEERMRALQMSPAEEKIPDDIRSRLSLVWRTAEGHRQQREIERERLANATAEFKQFLKERLKKVYLPSDHDSLKDKAPEDLEKQRGLVDEILLEYLKQEGFKPIKPSKTGEELSVEWRIGKSKYWWIIISLCALPFLVIAFWSFSINSSCYLSVNSIPSGATLIVDGVGMGRTPQTELSIKPGTHRILLKKGGRTIEQIVTVKSGEKRQLVITLTEKSLTSPATVSPAQRPENTPSSPNSSEQPNTGPEILRFIERYVEDTAKRDLNLVLTHYDEQVDYFSKGIVRKDFIRRDKELYFKRWTTIVNTIEGTPKIEDNFQGNIVVRFVSRFLVRNEKQTISGRADNTWTLRKVNSQWKIAGEQQQVLSRERNY